MIFFSLTEAPLPDPTPTPPRPHPDPTPTPPNDTETDPKLTRNGPNGPETDLERTRDGPEIKLSGVVTARGGGLSGYGGGGVCKGKRQSLIKSENQGVVDFFCSAIHAQPPAKYRLPRGSLLWGWLVIGGPHHMLVRFRKVLRPSCVEALQPHYPATFSWRFSRDCSGKSKVLVFVRV